MRQLAPPKIVALVAQERNTGLEESSRPWKGFFWQPCSYLFSAQASYTSGSLARVEEESQDSQGCSTWTGSQPISFFISPHAADADIQKENSRRSWHTAALPARGMSINCPENFLTAAVEWGKYTRNVIFLLNCIKLMTFPSPFAPLYITAWLWNSTMLHWCKTTLGREPVGINHPLLFPST